MKNLKTIPHFTSEAEESVFWMANDSTDYIDWSKADHVRLSSLKPSETTNPHIGSSFDSFLKEEGILEEVEANVLNKLNTHTKTEINNED